jgi:hypothetical protein
VTAARSFGFADEMRIGLRGMVRRVWGKRGVKVRRRVQLSYQWRYLLLVVDGQAGAVYWCWLETMAAWELLGVVRAIQQQTNLAAVVWDGAPSHHAERVRALGLPLIDLPPYSPELNPAERLIAAIRAELEGEVYASLDDKVAAAQRILGDLDADPERVRGLCGWAWIQQAADAVPQPLAIAA